MEEEKTVLPFQMVEQSWNGKAKIWNCVYILDFQKVQKGDYILKINLINPQKETDSVKNILLKII